jgi:hypothetical protein
MKKLLLILFLIPNLVMGENIYKKCLSESGKSSYDINFDTSALKGVMQYKFSGQDVTYEILSAEYKDGVFRGIASFLKATSSQTTDEPFLISYDTRTNILQELSVSYSCK